MSHHTKAEKTKGKVKEAAGDITGDKGLKREGKVDQASAKTKETVERGTEKVKGAVNPKR